jgi:hypothetical protein
MTVFFEATWFGGTAPMLYPVQMVALDDGSGQCFLFNGDILPQGKTSGIIWSAFPNVCTCDALDSPRFEDVGHVRSLLSMPALLLPECDGVSSLISILSTFWRFQSRPIGSCVATTRAML